MQGYSQVQKARQQLEHLSEFECLPVYQAPTGLWVLSTIQHPIDQPLSADQWASVFAHRLIHSEGLSIKELGELCGGYRKAYDILRGISCLGGAPVYNEDDRWYILMDQFSANSDSG